MDDKELAELRLKTWQALRESAAGNVVNLAGVNVRTTDPWDWETHRRKADELVEWMLSPRGEDRSDETK